MNLQEMIIDLWEQLGEPSDYDPYDYSGATPVFDITSEGAKKCIRRLNAAQIAIANWKFPNGDLIRIRELEETVYFKGQVISGTAQGGGSDTITLAAASGTVADQFKSWVIKITGGTGEGQKRLVISFDEATQVATVSEDWDTQPDSSSEYELYKGLYHFLPSTHALSSYNIPLSPANDILSIYALYDVKQEIRLYPAERTNTFATQMKSIGTPSTYMEKNGGIQFNVAVGDKRAYRIDYAKMPEELSSASDVPELPKQYHTAMVIWATWWSLGTNQESGLAYAKKRDLDDYMSRIKSQQSLKYDRLDGHIIMDMEG